MDSINEGCVICGVSGNLEVVPHRNKSMQSTALIFVCSGCCDKVVGMTTEIRFEPLGAETVN